MYPSYRALPPFENIPLHIQLPRAWKLRLPNHPRPYSCKARNLELFVLDSQRRFSCQPRLRASQSRLGSTTPCLYHRPFETTLHYRQHVQMLSAPQLPSSLVFRQQNLFVTSRRPSCYPFTLLGHPPTSAQRRGVVPHANTCVPAGHTLATYLYIHHAVT